MDQVMMLISQCALTGLNSNFTHRRLNCSVPMCVRCSKLVHAGERERDRAARGEEGPGLKAGNEVEKMREWRNPRRWAKPSVSNKNSDLYLVPCSFCGVAGYWFDLSWKECTAYSTGGKKISQNSFEISLNAEKLKLDCTIPRSHGIFALTIKNAEFRLLVSNWLLWKTATPFHPPQREKSDGDDVWQIHLSCTLAAVTRPFRLQLCSMNANVQMHCVWICVRTWEGTIMMGFQLKILSSNPMTSQKWPHLWPACWSLTVSS